MLSNSSAGSESNSRVTLDAIVVASEQVLSSALGDEVVLLEMEKGVYYGLNEVGARIWELIQKPTQVRDLCREIIAEYDVEPEQCSRDTLAIVAELTEIGLADVAGKSR